MAHVFSHRPLTTEAPVHARVSPCGICGGQSATMAGFFSEFFDFPLSVSFHHCSILITPPHEVCNNSDQALHYHTLRSKLEASSLTQHLAGKRERCIYLFLLCWIIL
jgi:hypothetical protein